MTLTERRKQLNMKQEDVAEKLEVDRSTVSKWENGEFLPGTDNLIKLSLLYACSIDDLIKEKPPAERGVV